MLPVGVLDPSLPAYVGPAGQKVFPFWGDFEARRPLTLGPADVDGLVGGAVQAPELPVQARQPRAAAERCRQRAGDA